MRIGILIPSSEFYPYLGSDFIQGLQQSLNIEIEILEEEIGVASPVEIQNASRKLITRKNVDILTGWLGYKSITAIRPLIQQTQTPLIMCNSGEIPVLEIDKSPFIVHCSLNMFKSMYLAAKWGFQEFGSDYVNLVSFFEAGYPSAMAVNLASENYNGNILGIEVSHKDGDKEIASKLNKLLTLNPKFLFASYSGWDAVDFLNTINDSSQADVPIISNGMLTEKTVLRNTFCENLYFVNSWDKPNNEVYPELQKEFENITRRDISPFGLIGYCVGLIIQQMIEKGWSYKSEIIDFLPNEILNSPIGKLTFNSTLNSFESDHLLFQTTQNTKATDSFYQKIKHLIPSDEDITTLNSINKDFGGWTNTYLCI